MHAEQFGLVELYFDEVGSPVSSDHGSSPHVIHALFRRFLSDIVLREAHDAVSRAEQRDDEDEDELSERICKASRLFRQVFSKDELVNFYVQQLRISVREIVGQHDRQMTHEKRQSLSAVRQMVCAIGRFQRALIGEVMARFAYRLM